MSDPEITGRIAEILRTSNKSQTAFAAEIGMDPTKLSKSLSGARRFTSFELAAIAELGETTVEWILTGKDRVPPALAARAQSAEAPASRAISSALVLESVFETLASLGVTRRATAFEPPSLSGITTAVDQGMRLARAAREYCEAVKPEVGPDDLPKYVEHIFGVDVAILDLDEGIDGLSWCRGEFRLALISNGVAWTRQRFTLAHELGHILAGDAQDMLVDLDVMSPTSRNRESEMRASVFAADFLMPEEKIPEVGREITDDHFARLLQEFGVSPSALAWRLYTLRRVDQARRAELGNMSIRYAALRGGWMQEFQQRTRLQSARRAPGILAEQAFDAYSEGEIGARPLAAVLGVPVDSLLHTPVIAPAPGSAPAEEPVFSP